MPGAMGCTNTLWFSITDHQRFWDAVNFSRGANPPREEWKVLPQRPAEQTEQAFERFAKYIDHVKWTASGVDIQTGSAVSSAVHGARRHALREVGMPGLARKWKLFFGGS